MKRIAGASLLALLPLSVLAQQAPPSPDMEAAGYMLNQAQGREFEARRTAADWHQKYVDAQKQIETLTAERDALKAAQAPSTSK